MRVDRRAYWRERYRRTLAVRLQARVRYLERLVQELRAERWQWTRRMRWHERAIPEAEREHRRQMDRARREKHHDQINAARRRRYWLRKCGHAEPRRIA